MRKKYPSDINRKQFKKIVPFLEGARKKTRPRTIDLYDAFCGVLYVLKSGCQWRMLPSDFPKWRSVHAYFQIWSEKREGKPSVLEEALKKIVGEARISNGRKEKTSFCIVDAQSVKNTDTAEEKGYDAGKKVSGIKRHIAVDTQGLPHGIEVTTANITDRAGAIALVAQAKETLSDVKNMLADGGYTGEPFAASIKEILGATVQIVKRNELHTFVVLPQRWVVERSFGWLEKCRRLWKNCERKLNTSLQMVVLAFLSLVLKRF
ncbi:MAG: IS5 family transposase [Candidatus Spechtbacteria bacterium]|nr:IS5 family transposase [Candidatus Spechtbacteria bacterium]